MPCYEYSCSSCGFRADITMSLKAYETSTDPCCAVCGNDMGRVVSAVAVQFKGSGWTPKFGKRADGDK